ncbi:unnamed protein product [Allacma fusca]|nr:unnamed protein product [Allacma fusca]
MNVPYNPNLWSKEKQKFEPTDNAKDLESLGGGKNFTDVFDLMNIEAPERLKNKSVGDYLQSVDWKNNRLSKKLQRRWQKGKHYAYCTAHGRKRIPLKEFVIDYPKYAKKPPQVDEVCAA